MKSVMSAYFSDTSTHDLENENTQDKMHPTESNSTSPGNPSAPGKEMPFNADEIQTMSDSK